MLWLSAVGTCLDIITAATLSHYIRDGQLAVLKNYDSLGAATSRQRYGIPGQQVGAVGGGDTGKVRRPCDERM